jgi:hypothetical protein
MSALPVLSSAPLLRSIGVLGYSAAAECCVRCAQRAEECLTDSLVPVMLLDLVLVVRQVSPDSLAETEAETKASPRPAEPTELGALNAAGRTNVAEEPHGSGGTVPSPSRSVLLPPAHTSAQNCNCIGCSSCRSMAAMAAFLGPFESLGTPRSPCAVAAANRLLSAILGATQCSTAFVMQTASRPPALLRCDTAELDPAHGGDGHHHDSTTGLYALRYSLALPIHSLHTHARPHERTSAKQVHYQSPIPPHPLYCSTSPGRKARSSTWPMQESSPAPAR